jgi:hypothetical protein
MSVAAVVGLILIIFGFGFLIRGLGGAFRVVCSSFSSSIGVGSDQTNRFNRQPGNSPH